MIKLIIVKNAFSPQDGREVKELDYSGPVKDLKEQNAIDGVDLQATINGYSAEDDAQVKDGDFVVIYPMVAKGGKGGKSILGIVAAIALSVVSFGVGGLASGAGMWGAGMGAWTTAGYIAAAATMFLGSTLLGRLNGQKVDKGSYESENAKATYSWGDIQTMEGQNNPVALTYGTVKSGGQTIGKYVKIDDNEEYLNWLVAAGEGPLSFSDIKLNDNDYDDYSGVSINKRAGTNDQDVITAFNDTYSSKTLNYKLKTSWLTDEAPGSDTRGLIFTIEFPNGLYHVTDTGKLETAWVQLDIEYKVSGGSWTNLFKEVSSNSYGIALRTNVGAGSYNFILSGQTRTVYSDGDENELFDSCYIKIGSDTANASKSDINKGRTITVGSFYVDLSKLSESVKNGILDGNSYSGTITVSAGSGTGRVSAKSRSAVRKQFRVNHITAGEYAVRVKVKSRQYAESDNQASSTCYWTGLTSVIYDNFSYPCTALLGIKAKATDQLSGSPSLTFLKSRANVWVWNGSSYVQKRAYNPAWACYDLLHQARRLMNVNTGNYEFEVRGVPANRMRYDDFAAWAAWCDSMRLYVDIEINTSGEMLEVANQMIAPIGRGMVVRFGTKYGCIYDHVQDPVQMFTMGNIVSGTFQEEFLKVEDRANCVEVTFTNKDADYQRDVLTVYGDTFDTDGYAKTAQLTMDGICRYTQAYREGKYQLMCNKYQLRTVSFEADIDAIACTVGDVVLISHDVPKWAYSGRIEGVDTDTGTLTLPCYVEDTSESYSIQYRTQDDTMYTQDCTITSTSEDGWTTVTVSDTTNLPAVGDVFDLAISTVGAKPFVVKSITRAQDFRRRLTCIEYSEDLFDESYDIPPIQYAMGEDHYPKNVTRLSASQYAYTDSAGTAHNVLSVSWQRPDNGGRFTVLYSEDKSSWKIAVQQTSADNIEVDVEPGDYYVKVITTLGILQSSGVTVGLILKGEDALPPDVTKFDVEKMASGTRRFWWEFEYPTPNDIAGFRIKYTQSTNPYWEAGIPVQTGLITEQPFETELIRQGAHAVMIKAVDYAGQESENFAYCILDLGDLLEENVLYSVDFSENDWEAVTHDGVISNGSIVSADESNQWTSPANLQWSTETDYMWVPKLNELNASMQLMAPASGQFWLQNDIDGPAIVYYCKSTTANQWTYPKNAQWTGEDENRWTEEYGIWKQWSDRIIVDAGDILHIKIVGLNDNNVQTSINSVVAYIDVPDINEHFEDLTISASGTTLPINTPNYYTTAVRLDAVQNSTATMVKYISRTPCVIQLLDGNGDAVDGTADITWQGYRKETIS